jgi:hypothetical protein
MTRWILCLLLLHSINAWGASPFSGLKQTCVRILGGEGFPEKVEALFSVGNAKDLVATLKPEFERASATKDTDGLPQKFFELYLDARLKMLPPKVADAVRDWMELGRFESVASPSKIGGHFDYVRNKVKIYLPKEFHYSLFYFYILAHEIEHSIQTMTVGIGSRTYLNPIHFPVHRFSFERGAIRAEAAFLLAIPSKYFEIFRLHT